MQNEDEFNTKIDRQNKVIFSYLATITISVVTTLIMLKLVGAI